jgi:probable selenium-dependent hydroxylase accessory protein YqeC
MNRKMDRDQKVVYSMIEKHVKVTEKKAGDPHSLARSLGLEAQEVISLVGAGGKTTLMFRLAKELLVSGEKVVTTTTTKILEPDPGETESLFVDSEEERLKQFVLQHLEQYRHVTVATERLGSGKLRGVSAALVDDLRSFREIDKIIVEADGAARRPVKAPREGEPVIPSNTTRVVALLGVDGVGMALNEENVFQAERVSRMTGVPMGGRITEESMAILMTHPEGLFKGAPTRSRVVAFINKMDLSGGMAKGKAIARKILEMSHPQIERVVLGQLKTEPPVAEVLFPCGEKR